MFLVTVNGIRSKKAWREVYRAEEPVLLAHVLDAVGASVDQPCGGVGRCGKCRVTASGALSEPTPSERERLSEEELGRGVRLACLCRAMGDCTVTLTDAAGIVGLAEGGEDVSSGAPTEPLFGLTEGYGAAVDIGTTTVAAYLVSLSDGRVIARRCVGNPQTAWGADVIARIRHAATADGADQLYRSIRTCVSDLIGSFGEPVAASVVTGNTTMLHLYEKLDPASLAVAPFTPVSLFGCVAGDGKTFYPPCLSAYVGADITCAILSGDLLSHRRAMLVDIGTNGEMVLWADGRLYGAATAAGPAFEGAGLSCGCPAVPGAVAGVWLEDGAVKYRTVGDAAPVGLCGSGLLDAVAVMRKLGVLDETGYLEAPFFIGDSGVSVTPADIRQLQLAKAAVRAGIDTLLDEAGIAPEDLDAFYLAGGFGSYLDPESAAAIGLLPRGVLAVSRAVGNAAGAGAVRLLCNRSLVKKAAELAEQVHLCELSADARFMEHYIDEMMF